MIGLLFKSLPHKIATRSWSSDKMSIVLVRIASILRFGFALLRPTLRCYFKGWWCLSITI